MTITKLFFFMGGLFSMLAVILGAFGAHALKTRIAPDMLAVYEVGVRYQMYHALALIIIALALPLFPINTLEIAGWLFVLGIILFSGSLYTLTFTQNSLWGAVTPIGGLIWIVAWIFVCITPFKA